MRLEDYIGKRGRFTVQTIGMIKDGLPPEIHEGIVVDMVRGTVGNLLSGPSEATATIRRDDGSHFMYYLNCFTLLDVNDIRADLDAALGYLELLRIGMFKDSNWAVVADLQAKYSEEGGS